MPELPIASTARIVSQYGLATTLAVILVLVFIALFYFVLRWVVKLNQTMMENAHQEKMALSTLVNVGLKNVADALHQNTLVCQEIMRNIKDGFDSQKKADDYHRSDLKEIYEDIHGLKKSVDDNVCQFYEKKV